MRRPRVETPSSDSVKLGALDGSAIHSACCICRWRRRSRTFALRATRFAILRTCGAPAPRITVSSTESACDLARAMSASSRRR